MFILGFNKLINESKQQQINNNINEAHGKKHLQFNIILLAERYEIELQLHSNHAYSESDVIKTLKLINLNRDLQSIEDRIPSQPNFHITCVCLN